MTQENLRPPKRLTLEDMERAESFTRGLLGVPAPKAEPAPPVLRFEVWDRGSGKTVALVDWLKEETDEDRVLLVMTERERTRLRNEYRLTDDQVISRYHFVERVRHRRRLVVRVEDGNALFRSLLEHHMPGIHFETIMVADEQRGPEHG